METLRLWILLKNYYFVHQKSFLMVLLHQPIKTIMFYEFDNKLGETECHKKMSDILGIITVSCGTVTDYF